MASTGSSFSGETVDPVPDRADVVVGLTSFNDAGTAGVAAGAAAAGLAQDYGQLASRVVLADGGSTDDTRARVEEALRDRGTLTQIEVVPASADRLTMPYHGFVGRARALRAVLVAARDLEARACVAIDGSLQAMRPDWVHALVEPILSGTADFVTPRYLRHVYEGALTRGVVYPVFRALFGARLRQPAASEFACSPRLLSHLVDEEFWDVDGAQSSVDLRLTASVVAGDFRMCEVTLGHASHRPRGAADLATTVSQIMGALFDEIEMRANVWQRARGIKPVSLCDGTEGASLEDAPPAVDVEHFIESFRLGYRELRELWTWVLPPKTIVDLSRVAKSESSAFRLSDELWALIVYDFALGYRLRSLAREHLLRSFVPLYLGWFASFVLEARALPPDAVDARVDRLAAAFEAQKSYLIARWRWPERFRT